MTVNCITWQISTFYCKSASFLCTVSFKLHVAFDDCRSRERQRILWTRIERQTFCSVSLELAAGCWWATSESAKEAFHIHCVVCFYRLSMFIGCCFTLLDHCSSNVFMCFWHICSTLMFKADVVYARATSISVVILRLLLKWLLCDAFTSMTLWFCYFLKGSPVSRPKRALVDC